MAETIQNNLFGLDLHDFINFIEQGVLIEDSAGKVKFANQKLLKLLDYSLGEIMGRSWRDIVPKEEWQTVEQELKTCRKEKKCQYEAVILTKTGQKIPVIVCAQPLIKNGKYQGIIKTFTDITEHKQTEQEIKSKSERLELMNRALNLQRKKLIELTELLEKANQELRRLSEAKSDFVSAVSHDLRTPLTTIIEGISLVADGTLGEVNEEQKKFLRLAIEDAERLNDFINDILDLAKIEAGKLVVKKTKVNPKEMIARLKTSYENYLKDKGLELTIELPKDEISIFCDAGHYYRVLTNFLSNAIKFTPAGGKITIQVNQQKGGVVLTSVKDTGVGIPPEQKHHIFQKFEQVERKSNQRGSGLGLSLCKQLVELNGGRIGFESEVNKGSNFYFSLPSYDEITDFSYMLETTNQRAQTISAHTVVFLFKPAIKSDQDSQEALAKIAEVIQPKTLAYDLIRIFITLKTVVLVSPLPEESAQPTFMDLVETLQKAMTPTKILATFYVCPEVLPNPRTVLRILESQLQST